MAGWRLWLGFFGWCSLVASAGAVAELSTVAYAVDRPGFDEIGSEWHWRDLSGLGEIDPFAVDVTPAEKFVEPMRLEKKPNGSRFFEDGDRMWLLTGTLRQQKILENERSWAVWNEDRNRLVVHGTTREHGWVAMLWEELQQQLLLETSVELVKVRCRELTGVDWTEEEVRKRGGQVLHSIATTARPGQKASGVIATEAGEVLIDSENNCGSEMTQVDVRVAYEAAVRHPDGIRNLEVRTGMTAYAGHRVYVEVGGASTPGETYLLGVKAFPKFLDGTPSWRWREFEDESAQEEPIGLPTGGDHRVLLDDGKVFVRDQVWPGYVDVFVGGSEDGDIDPFAPDDPKMLQRRQEAGVRPVETLPDVPGCRKTDVVLDITGLMKDQGLNMPEGTWVYFNKTRSVVMATMTPIDADLFEGLMSNVLYCGTPKMIRGSASLIEWEGELEPGKIPAGARRLARAGVVARPGQKATVRHGLSADGLKRGVSLEMEPNIGANERILDVRFGLEVAGGRAARLQTGLTMIAGDPVVVPLGEEGGKKFGVVVEVWVIDGTGAEVGR